MGNNLAGQLDEHEPQLMSILDAEMDARKCNNYPYHYFPLPLTLDIYCGRRVYIFSRV